MRLFLWSGATQLLEEQAVAVDRLAALHHAAYSISSDAELAGLYDEIMCACSAKITSIERLCVTLLKQGEGGHGVEQP
ncbi:MAG: hypothetical protein V6Z86_05150 [Hyphomicrobiales bacterium]